MDNWRRQDQSLLHLSTSKLPKPILYAKIECVMTARTGRRSGQNWWPTCTAFSCAVGDPVLHRVSSMTRHPSTVVLSFSSPSINPAANQQIPWTTPNAQDWEVELQFNQLHAIFENPNVNLLHSWFMLDGKLVTQSVIESLFLPYTFALCFHRQGDSPPISWISLSLYGQRRNITT